MSLTDDDLAQYIGERALGLVAYALTGSAGDREPLLAAEEDPDSPQVTEAEQLLIDWARLRGRGQQLTDAAAHRFESTFTPATRALLESFAVRTLGSGA